MVVRKKAAAMRALLNVSMMGSEHLRAELSTRAVLSEGEDIDAVVAKLAKGPKGRFGGLRKGEGGYDMVTWVLSWTLDGRESGRQRNAATTRGLDVGR